MNNLITNEIEGLAPVSKSVTHLVESVDSQYSWCGVDVTEAKWGKGLGTPVCEECDFRWRNCNCKICMESRFNV